MKSEDMRTFVKFIHKSTLNSKEKILEELRSAHPNITSSRAQAMRILVLIANKRRSKSGGFIWEVKVDVLKSLGLDELISEESVELETKNKTHKSTLSQDASFEHMRTFVKFVHHSTLNSKEKLLEEFRFAHPNTASSRAEAMRQLILIANKRRRKNGGVIWEVKRDVLKSLGLQELIVNYSPLNKNKTPNSPTLHSCCGLSPKKVTPMAQENNFNVSRAKKRQLPQVSLASANLLASFLKRKKSKSLF